MGAQLIDQGATFRVWAPRAKRVYVIRPSNGWIPEEPAQLTPLGRGHWGGYLPEYNDGSLYKFWIDGEGTAGPKRDPYARELEVKWPDPACILRNAGSFPWQDQGWRPPDFSDLIVYQFHVGTYFGPNREGRVAKFLDVLDRIEYLADLGVNAIEPLPIVEYSTARSMGYNGSDLFSPEMDYQVSDGELDGYLSLANRLLTARGKAGLSRATLAVPINQLKALIDICHHFGIAVLLDVVYNHASGDVKGQPESIYFFDRWKGSDPNESQYFTDRDHTGPVFAFSKPEVRQFLIDNARFFLDEYHVDGFRYDQVTVIDHENPGSGWLFCQDLNGTLRAVDASAINIAEYWGPEPTVVRRREDGGAGFDANWHDGLRRSIRGVIAQASGGRNADVRWQPVVDHLRAPGFPNAWRAVQCIESHDEVYRDRAPRIAALAAGGVRDQPVACGDGPLAHSARDSHDLHGTGVLRGQTLGRRSAESPVIADLLGWLSVRSYDDRLPSLHSRVGVAAPAIPRVARRRRRDSRDGRLQPRPRVPAMGGRLRPRRHRGRESQ